MKKRGSVLSTVLIAGTVLLIVGSAISISVINTNRLNKKYSQSIDLELAAKSAMNYGIDKLVTIGGIDGEEITIEWNPDNVYKEFNKSALIEKTIKKNEYKITGIAILNENIETRESKLVVIGDKGDVEVPPINPDEGGNTLVFDRLFNIGKNIDSFGNNNQGAMQYFQYGLTCNTGSNNGNNKPDKNEELTNINVSINVSKILEHISTYSSIPQLEHKNNQSIDISNAILNYDQLKGDNTNLKLQGAKVLFANGGYTQNGNCIELISNDELGSELIFGGNTVFNTGMNINNAENSTFIVNGSLTVNGGPFSIKSAENSMFIINGDLHQSGNGINVKLKDSIVIIGGTISPQNNFNLELENSAFIVLGDMNLNTQVRVINNGNSFIYCGGNYRCNSEIIIKNNNGGGYVPNSKVVNSGINRFLNISNK